MFTKLRQALTHFLHRGEEEVHAVVTALEADVKPLLAAAEARATAAEERIVAAVEAAVANGKVDLEALAKLVAAELAKLWGGQQPQPPAQS